MRIRNVRFHRSKYGGELLVDVGRIETLEGFIRTPEPYRLDFYDIMLVTGGGGEFWLDTTRMPLEPDRVYFTTPGQVRRFVTEDPDALTGLTLFFTSDFIGEFFNDPLFLSKLQFFHNPAVDPTLRLEDADAARLGERLLAMCQEIEVMKGDSVHMLRAMLYEVLIRLNRQYAAQHGTESQTETHPVVHRFRQLIEERFRETHRVADYADRLAVTPGHLTELTRRYLGVTAGEAIRGRVLVEAKRLVLYSGETVERVAGRLGFADPSYFSRFFKRHTGHAPVEYRRIVRERLSG